MSLRVLSVCATLAVIGCAGHTPGPAGSDDAATQQSTRRNRDLISREELAAASMQARSVLEVVRSLRPHFLNSRGTNSNTNPEAGQVHASINNGRVVSVDDLQHILVSTVAEIQYLNVAAAMLKFGGAAHEGPVILVRLK